MTALREVLEDPRVIVAFTDREITDLAEANYTRALEAERLARSNYANCVPWRLRRWLRVHREFETATAEIRAISAAIRAERARRWSR